MRTVRAHREGCKLTLPAPVTKRMLQTHEVPRGPTECTCGGGTLIRLRRPAR